MSGTPTSQQPEVTTPIGSVSTAHSTPLLGPTTAADPPTFSMLGGGGGGGTPLMSLNSNNTSNPSPLPFSTISGANHQQPTPTTTTTTGANTNNNITTTASSTLQLVTNNNTASTTSSPAAHEYIPPNNFSMICEGVYRSSYPTKKNFTFLKDVVQLRSICYLCPEDYPDVNNVFNAANGIQLLRFQMDGNKEPLQEIPPEKMHAALSAIIDTRNHPILIHCNAGKHRTGCVSGCVRKLQGWSLVSIYSEYLHFAGEKPRLADQMFIEMYSPSLKVPRKFAAPWLAVLSSIAAQKATTTSTSPSQVDEITAATPPELTGMGIAASTAEGGVADGEEAGVVVERSIGVQQQDRDSNIIGNNNGKEDEENGSPVETQT